MSKRRMHGRDDKGTIREGPSYELATAATFIVPLAIAGNSGHPTSGPVEYLVVFGWLAGLAIWLWRQRKD